MTNNQADKNLSFLVMGAGSIGSVIGGFLAKAGHRVCFCGREAHMNVIRDNGLKIIGIWGNHHIQISDTVTDIKLFSKDEEFDYVLLTVKAFDTKEAIESLKNAINEQAVIVSLQNGLGNVELIAEAFGQSRTIGGRVIFGAQINEPGLVEVTVYAEEVMLGSPYGLEEINFRSEELSEIMNASGIPVLPTHEINKFLWAKLLYNACLNPACTLLQAPYGYMLETDDTRRLMSDIIKETFAVAHARNVDLFQNSPEEYEKILFERLIPSTKAHYPSMWQDIRNGRRTEIDAMNGAVVKWGIESGINAPVNASLVRLINALEKRGFPA